MMTVIYLVIHKSFVNKEYSILYGKQATAPPPFQGVLITPQTAVTPKAILDWFCCKENNVRIPLVSQANTSLDE
jgi:hypothetical protein